MIHPSPYKHLADNVINIHNFGMQSTQFASTNPPTFVEKLLISVGFIITGVQALFFVFLLLVGTPYLIGIAGLVFIFGFGVCVPGYVSATLREHRKQGPLAALTLLSASIFFVVWLLLAVPTLTGAISGSSFEGAFILLYWAAFNIVVFLICLASLVRASFIKKRNRSADASPEESSHVRVILGLAYVAIALLMIYWSKM